MPEHYASHPPAGSLVVVTPEQAADVVVAALPLQRPAFVAVDGPSASGTSTLGDVLAARLHAVVVHSDDFYRDMPVKERERLDAARN